MSRDALPFRSFIHFYLVLYSHHPNLRCLPPTRSSPSIYDSYYILCVCVMSIQNLHFVYFIRFAVSVHIFPLPLPFALSYPNHVHCARTSPSPFPSTFESAFATFSSVRSLALPLTMRLSSAATHNISLSHGSIVNICPHIGLHFLLPFNFNEFFVLLFSSFKPVEIECADNKIHYASSCRCSWVWLQLTTLIVESTSITN